MSYEVVPDNVNLIEHLGHKVTISGTSNEGEEASTMKSSSRLKGDNGQRNVPLALDCG